MKYKHLVVFAALANKETGEHKKLVTLPLPLSVYEWAAKTAPTRRKIGTVFKGIFWLSIPFFLGF